MGINSDSLPPPQSFHKPFLVLSNVYGDQMSQRKARQDVSRPTESQDSAKGFDEEWTPADHAEWMRDSAEYAIKACSRRQKKKKRASRVARRKARPHKKRSRGRRDPSLPMKPRPIFLLYSNHQRHGIKRKNPCMSNGDISQLLSQMWKNETLEVKAQYKRLVAKDKARYAKEMAALNDEDEESVESVEHLDEFDMFDEGVTQTLDFPDQLFNLFAL